MSKLFYLIRRLRHLFEGESQLPEIAGGRDEESQGRMLPRLYIPESSTSLGEVEHAMVELAMRQANGNQTHAAAWLDISRDALRYKLKKFGVVHVEEEESGQDRRSRHRIFYSCCDSHRPMLWLGVGDYVAGTVVVRDKHSEEIRPD